MTTIRAHFDGRVFVPDEAVALPQGFAVTLHIDAIQNRQGSPSKAELLERLAELEKMAEAANAPEADFSRDSIYSGNLDDPR